MGLLGKNTEIKDLKRKAQRAKRKEPTSQRPAQIRSFLLLRPWVFLGQQNAKCAFRRGAHFPCRQSQPNQPKLVRSLKLALPSLRAPFFAFSLFPFCSRLFLWLCLSASLFLSPLHSSSASFFIFLWLGLRLGLVVQAFPFSLPTELYFDAHPSFWLTPRFVSFLFSDPHFSSSFLFFFSLLVTRLSFRRFRRLRSRFLASDYLSDWVCLPCILCL